MKQEGNTLADILTSGHVVIHQDESDGIYTWNGLETFHVLTPGPKGTYDVIDQWTGEGTKNRLDLAQESCKARYQNALDDAMGQKANPGYA